MLLRYGGPLKFLKLLPISLQSCQKSMSGNLELALLPRPPALLEAARRHFAVQKKVQLD